MEEWYSIGFTRKGLPVRSLLEQTFFYFFSKISKIARSFLVRRHSKAQHFHLYTNVRTKVIHHSNPRSHCQLLSGESYGKFCADFPCKIEFQKFKMLKHKFSLTKKNFFFSFFFLIPMQTFK